MKSLFLFLTLISFTASKGTFNRIEVKVRQTENHLDFTLINPTDELVALNIKAKIEGCSRALLDIRDFNSWNDNMNYRLYPDPIKSKDTLRYTVYLPQFKSLFTSKENSETKDSLVFILYPFIKPGEKFEERDLRKVKI